MERRHLAGSRAASGIGRTLGPAGRQRSIQGLLLAVILATNALLLYQTFGGKF
jgi:hypothetical protein